MRAFAYFFALAAIISFSKAAPMAVPTGDPGDRTRRGECHVVGSEAMCPSLCHKGLDAASRVLTNIALTGQVVDFNCAAKFPHLEVNVKKQSLM